MGYTREQEMALIGMAMTGRASRTLFGYRKPTKRQLLTREIAAKAKRLITTNATRTEKPEITLRSLIKAGLGKIVRRRNKPPLFVPIIPKTIR